MHLAEKASFAERYDLDRTGLFWTRRCVRNGLARCLTMSKKRYKLGKPLNDARAVSSGLTHLGARFPYASGKHVLWTVLT